jgi:hypothetical protein
VADRATILLLPAFIGRHASTRNYSLNSRTPEPRLRAADRRGIETAKEVKIFGATGS